jgi:hypothetical protein
MLNISEFKKTAATLSSSSMGRDSLAYGGLLRANQVASFSGTSKQ